MVMAALESMYLGIVQDSNGVAPLPLCRILFNFKYRYIVYIYIQMMMMMMIDYGEMSHEICVFWLMFCILFLKVGLSRHLLKSRSVCFWFILRRNHVV